jgi:hypothetical protein
MKPVDNSPSAGDAGRQVPLSPSPGLADSEWSPNSSSYEGVGDVTSQALGERHVFEPTTDRPPETPRWLTDDIRSAFEQTLDDLPELCRQLELNYDALLARGDRDDHDSAIRYVTRFEVLDLADRRTKWETSANRNEPLTLADRGVAGPSVDPAWWADLNREAGARRQGVLPTLIGWISITVHELTKAGLPFEAPADPDQVVWAVDRTGRARATKPGPSIASQASWLRRRTGFIYDQVWARGMIAELAGIRRDLERIVGPVHARPDANTVRSPRELADYFDIPYGTIRRWISEGSLPPAIDAHGNPIVTPKGRQLYFLTDARGLAQTRRPTKKETR